MLFLLMLVVSCCNKLCGSCVERNGTGSTREHRESSRARGTGRSSSGTHAGRGRGRAAPALALAALVRTNLVAVGHGHDAEPAGGRVVLLLLQDLHVPHVQAAGCGSTTAAEAVRYRGGSSRQEAADTRRPATTPTRQDRAQGAPGRSHAATNGVQQRRRRAHLRACRAAQTAP